jgi:excinuclease ABC subunit B
MFVLRSEYDTAGDQQQAIDMLVEQINAGKERCILVGVTGSGKTFAMANIIKRLQIPTLILSHNKTLARQLWQEMSELFPENAVEYFVSYYDYYQPEAYIPGRDLFIDKELQMNERIEQERFSTVASLVSRPDVIAVGSVSIIYGLNPPEVFEQNHLRIYVGQICDPRDIVRELVNLQYRRINGEITRGDIRLRGEVLDI